MGVRFWTALFMNLILTLVFLAGAGWFISELVTDPPREKFVTSIFEFELYPGWSCEREGGEYVCTTGDKPPFPAIAILAMKYRGPQDRLDAYEAHLKKPREMQLREGGTRLSKIHYVRRRRVGQQNWVDALHNESELPGYLTHYMATTTSHIGAIVTFTAKMDRYDDYKPQFEEMMASLIIYQNR